MYSTKLRGLSSFYLINADVDAFYCTYNAYPLPLPLPGIDDFGLLFCEKGVFYVKVFNFSWNSYMYLEYRIQSS